MAANDRQPIQNRYDFVCLFDVTDGNPNGDPDAGNLPRIDPETGHGLVTDVCLKRKIRNYVAMTKGGIKPEPKYDIFVRERSVLNQTIERAYHESDKVKDSVRAWEAWKKDKKSPKPDMAFEDVARLWMCDNFFDIRAFGAVMTTGDGKEYGDSTEKVKAKIKMTAGQVRGPIQLGMARSIDPIVSLEHAITRCAVTNERDLEKERTIGRKFAVPYGLYRVHGFINANLADPEQNGTGFSEADLALFKKALAEMFEHDRSAARGEMHPRMCVAFRHEGKLGNARADQLFQRVQVSLKADVRDQKRPPRNFDDYAVAVDENNLPNGVMIERWV